MQLALLKYHGLGNDFLVLLDWEGATELNAATVAGLCDRRRGIGADGVLRLCAPTGGGSLAMELHNADGGYAETSGNGIRCAVLAAVDEGLVPAGAVRVETGAGLVDVEVGQRTEFGTSLRVAMGELKVGPGHPAGELALGPDAGAAERAELASLAAHTAFRVDIGNPHLVLVGHERVATSARVPLGRLGPSLEAAVPGGVNVEVVAPVDGSNTLQFDVWERGAGLTLACGSGSCAAAAAARADGVVGDRVVLHNPGGVLTVELSGDLDRPVAVLVGPAQRIGRIEVSTDGLVASPRASTLATLGCP